MKKEQLGDKLLLPANMMRSGEEVFLDDMTRQQLEQALRVPVEVVPAEGALLYEAILKIQQGEHYE